MTQQHPDHFAMGPQVFAAQHEAGHAAVALHLGWAVTKLHLHNFQDAYTDAEPVGIVDWREHVLVLLGGAAGEALVGVHMMPTSNVEEERAEARQRCANEVGVEAAAPECEGLTSEANHIVADRRALVGMLASEAIRCRTLRRDDIERIVAIAAPDLRRNQQS